MNIEEYFDTKLNELNIEATNDKTRRFKTYYEELVSYNENVNLTSIVEKAEVYEKHFIDSILPINFFKPNTTICDIGTGAGFPSLPIAIANEKLNIFAVDSLRKRIDFLSILIEKLGISNVRVFHSRAEDFAQKYRESFDYCVSRAVSRLNTLLEYCLPLVKEGGYMLAYKSLSYKEEIEESKNALKILGGKIEKILEFDLEISNQKRYIIVVKKINKTPLKYPRNQNKPKTQPL